MDAKLVKAFSYPDPEQGLSNSRNLAARLQNSYPSGRLAGEGPAETSKPGLAYPVQETVVSRPTSSGMRGAATNALPTASLARGSASSRNRRIRWAVLQRHTSSCTGLAVK